MRVLLEITTSNRIIAQHSQLVHLPQLLPGMTPLSVMVKSSMAVAIRAALLWNPPRFAGGPDKSFSTTCSRSTPKTNGVNHKIPASRRSSFKKLRLETGAPRLGDELNLILLAIISSRRRHHRIRRLTLLRCFDFSRLSGHLHKTARFGLLFRRETLPPPLADLCWSYLLSSVLQ